jgi:hypothetical protein
MALLLLGGKPELVIERKYVQMIGWVSPPPVDQPIYILVRPAAFRQVDRAVKISDNSSPVYINSENFLDIRL